MRILNRRSVFTATTAALGALAVLSGAVVPAAAQGRHASPASVVVRATSYPRVVTSTCETGPVGRRVLVVGDSLTVFTQATLERLLGAAGWSVCIDARRTETTRGSLDNYAAAGAFPAYVDVVVMATGTNDWVDPGAFVAQVSRARAFATGRPVLWLTTWVHPTRFAAREADAALAAARRVNAVIWKLVERTRPGSVVDWYATIAAGRGRAGQYLTDGVHTTAAGGRQRTALVLRALARLG